MSRPVSPAPGPAPAPVPSVDAAQRFAAALVVFRRAVHVAQEDLNGECFIAGAEGEIEELIGTNQVAFPFDSPMAREAGAKVVFTSDQVTSFLIVNIMATLPAGVNRSMVDRIKIAYIRYLAARTGLISPLFDPTPNHVKYNDCYVVNRDDTYNAIDAASKDAALLSAIESTLVLENRNKMRRMFTDMVCCVAYMFRVRGHHYKEDFQARYETLWLRCLHVSADLLLPWQLIATDALHAIMPVHLDAYWQTAVTNSLCAGTLIKRFDSAPAGVAGVYALQRGLADILMIFPGAPRNIPEHYTAFLKLMDQLKGNRWAGSINARYYGVTRLRIDESSFGALASVVMGVYEQLAPESKLKDSPALKRLAQIAPATGGAIGLAARNATADKRLNLLDMTNQVAYAAEEG